MKPFILGIESSCDETSASIIHGRKILSNVISHQKIHNKYGGVVPELASREHQKNIIPITDQALKNSGVKLNDLHAIAFTKEPGLASSLLVGESFSKSLSLACNIPLIEVNHIHAHVLCLFIEHSNHKKFPKFPFISLTVSGGHTQIILVRDYFNLEIIGTTIDDAAGEAFDKIGKMLGLSYPAGPLIDKLALSGNPKKYKFPFPKMEKFLFSFSGIKTSVLYFLHKKLKENPLFIKENIYDLCASIQYTIIEILINKIKLCLKETGIKNIALGGGVSANSYLRNRIKEYCNKNNYNIFIPDLEFTTDNAAMIALIGSLKYLKYHISL